ncbi:hypothetical protein [Dongia sedimenti]|uniref:UrcA family protein n=1 Tax=Dongia sedimenti TaxID=3064282 RepID=A0ABU0YUK7_9PROT|nr:hypothetical protein [Rhodospirillaceae bacterium R-7]
MRRILVAMAALLATAASGPGPALAANDYPTEVVADYVIGCLASNGETQDMLRRCSCSIDAVSSIVPYDTYEKASTILQMRQATGDATSVFREMKMLDDIVKLLRLAQIEADFRCF